MLSAQGDLLARHAIDLLSAALRHIRDAEHLLEAGSHVSFDQAYHLAGFAPECARKATLPMRWLDKAMGHSVDTLAEDVVRLIEAIDPTASRYAPPSYVQGYPALKAWAVECRYKRTGTYTRAEAEALCKEARKAVDAVVIALWTDGRIPDKEALW